MRIRNGLLAGMFALAASQAPAAVKDYDVRYRLAIREDGRLYHEPGRRPYYFRVEVVSDREGVKPEASRNGRPYVNARKGERYSVRLYNPLPVRVAANLTVDGLNSITGKPSGISDGSKWIIEPYGSITIPGWQVNGEETRRFFFTDKPKSYAKWRGDMTGLDLAANCGVIGAAFFWDQKELDRYYDDHPIVRVTERPWTFSASRAKKAGEASAPACADSAAGLRVEQEEAQEQAGTGMGERGSHPTREVDFHYDRGMYKLSQAVVIHYGFEEAPAPNPFPALGYAPEMPNHP